VLNEQGSFLYQYAVVRTGPTTYFVIALLSPHAEGERAKAVFDSVVSSFEILRTEQQQAELDQALERGRELIGGVAGGQIDLGTAVREEVYLRCLIDGREAGFVQIREEATRLDNQKGVAVSRWTWLFQPEGQVTHTRHLSFVSLDLVHEQWESRTMILPPESEDEEEPPPTWFDVESAVREGDKLLVRYTDRPNAPELTEKVIDIEPVYVPSAWDILFPRLVPLDERGLYAFAPYDSTRRGPILRACRVTGSEMMRIGDRAVRATEIETTEGLIPPVHRMRVDDDGRLIQVVVEGASPKMEFVSCSASYVQRTYHDRVEKAQKRISETVIAWPAPPRK
jgi:hypothetical protein